MSSGQVELLSGSETIVCEDKTGVNLDQFVYAVFPNRMSHIKTLDETLLLVRSMLGTDQPIMKVIENMEKEVAEGEDPRNLFLTCSYIFSLVTKDRDLMSYEHFLGYLPPALEDELNRDGTVFRNKGEAQVIFLTKKVADYINSQKETPVRAIVVSRPEMTRLLKENGYYGGDIDYGDDEVEDGVYIAKFPVDTQINPKMTTDGGAQSCAVWEYTNVQHVYTTCKKEDKVIKYEILKL